MVNALLIIDCQVDFIEGSLAVNNSKEIIPIINELHKSDKFSTVVFTLDWHPLNHSSFLKSENLEENIGTDLKSSNLDSNSLHNLFHSTKDNFYNKKLSFSSSDASKSPILSKLDQNFQYSIPFNIPKQKTTNNLPEVKLSTKHDNYNENNFKDLKKDSFYNRTTKNLNLTDSNSNLDPKNSEICNASSFQNVHKDTFDTKNTNFSIDSYDINKYSLSSFPPSNLPISLLKLANLESSQPKIQSFDKNFVTHSNYTSKTENSSIIQPPPPPPPSPSSFVEYSPLSIRTQPPSSIQPSPQSFTLPPPENSMASSPNLSYLPPLCSYQPVNISPILQHINPINSNKLATNIIPSNSKISNYNTNLSKIQINSNSYVSSISTIQPALNETNSNLVNDTNSLRTVSTSPHFSNSSFSSKSDLSSTSYFKQPDSSISELWPVHCVQYSIGAALYPLLYRSTSDFIIMKGELPNEPGYSAFDVPSLHTLLTSKNIKNVYLVGLCFDYCVGQTALHAKSLGYQNVICISDACKSISTTSHESMMDKLLKAGVQIQTSNSILK